MRGAGEERERDQRSFSALCRLRGDAAGFRDKRQGARSTKSPTKMPASRGGCGGVCAAISQQKAMPKTRGRCARACLVRLSLGGKAHKKNYAPGPPGRCCICNFAHDAILGTYSGVKFCQTLRRPPASSPAFLAAGCTARPLPRRPERHSRGSQLACRCHSRSHSAAESQKPPE